MNKLITIFGLSIISFSAVATGQLATIPEPEMLPLLGVGALTLALFRKIRK